MTASRIAVFALASALACKTAAPAPPAAAPAAGDDAERALAIADRVFMDDVEDSPFLGAALRLPGTRYDTMPDMTEAGRKARDDKRRAQLVELRKLDGARLAGTLPGLTREAAITSLEGRLGALVCNDDEWSLSAQGGFQGAVARLGEVQPVGTEDLRAQALSRWSKMGDYIDQIAARKREGLAKGYVASAPVAKAVVEQIDRILEKAPKDSPFLLPARKDKTEGFDKQLEQIVADKIHPALKRARDLIANEIAPKAREAVGVSNIPNGEQCYRAKLRGSLSLDRDPKELHKLGEDQLKVIEAEMTALSARSFEGKPVNELHAMFRDDPKWRYKDREEMLQQARAALARAREILPKAFRLLPKADVTIEPIPEFQERNAAPHYQAPAPDGSRPAQYRIRLYQAEKQSRIKGEDTAFHETIPGHHLERGLASERTDLPAFLRHEGSGAFSEGWGLYAERLADEMHLYSSDADRFGMLDGLGWRALRLIVDTGMHALGWSRQQAIDTLLAHSSLSADFAASEVDRYIAMPGQATSYMVGYLEIRALRERAEKELGDKFDLRTFHARVLENGSIPLDLLRRQIDRWIADGGK